ncbi:MAG: aromatic ring-hydroxylating dioxygenase subunit alpha [Actinobacteria bacterium]|nr:aromatic ring-hydroxylating dioxygenase subunit alpha [Actinomycetota bacterium]
MERTAAPIDRAVLERALLPFGESRTLPGEAYTSDGVLAWERAHFFGGSWVALGRADDVVPAPGDQRAVTAGTETVLLTRDAEGRIHGFFDVCRHRGHALMEPGQSRSAKVIQCPYHAWVYDLDGSLRGAPGFHTVPGFDRSEFPLVSLRVAEWRGWVFANASGDAPPLEDHLGNMDALIAGHEPERLVVAARHGYEVAANWKIVTENYHECYHCSNIHPELCRVTPPESGVNLDPDGTWVGGTMDLMDHAQTMSLTGESRGVMLRGLDEAARRQVLYLGLFPNLLISPHPDYVLTHRIEPLAPDRSRIECQWLFPPEAVEREGFDPAYAVEFWDVTNREDWHACEQVQRGVSSAGYHPGPLSRREDAVYQFITLVARGYLEGRATRPNSREPRLTEPA